MDQLNRKQSHAVLILEVRLQTLSEKYEAVGVLGQLWAFLIEEIYIQMKETICICYKRIISRLNYLKSLPGKYRNEKKRRKLLLHQLSRKSYFPTQVLSVNQRQKNLDKFQ